MIHKRGGYGLDGGEVISLSSQLKNKQELQGNAVQFVLVKVVGQDMTD